MNTVKVKVSELEGAALDYAVAKCEESTDFKTELRTKGYQKNKVFMKDISLSSAGGGYWANYSTNWAQGGPIIERERIAIEFNRFDEDNEPEWAACKYHDGVEGCGPTPLIAAMRCYVSSKLGDDVEIPNELL